jgi:hypothetical protein
MLVSRSGARVSGWCFRCNEGLHADLNLSIQDNLLRLRAATAVDAAYRDSVEQPGPLLQFADWPPRARLWFLRAGMADRAAAAIGAGWHAEMQRVVLPLRNSAGEPISWTARSVDDRTPKYLTGSLPDGFVAEMPGASPPVVTEDWLSACKVSLAGQHAISMLGTYPKPATLLRLLEFKKVFVWLDNDLPPKHRTNWGQQHASRLCRGLRAHGCAPWNIVSDLEPKELNAERIRATLARCATSRTPSVNAPDGEPDDRL